MEITLKPIAYIDSCFKEKFGIPRQPGLVTEARAQIIMHPPYSQPEAFKGIEKYSHIWIQFVFHQSIQRNWKATVRPPKMGGNTRIGVFASRSNFRPNPIGLSVVKLEEVKIEDGKVVLVVKGGDFLDQTPVIDIKPYIPYSDAVPNASSGLSCPHITFKEVTFTTEALTQLQVIEKEIPSFTKFVEELLQNDPRPGYQADPDRIYGCHVYDYNLKWQCSEHEIKVLSIGPALA